MAVIGFDSKIGLQIKKIRDYHLYMKDIKVLTFNVSDKSIFIIHNEDYLPLRLRNNCNIHTFEEWLKIRALPISRENAKWLLNKLKLQQRTSILTSLFVKGLSLNDPYWIKMNDEDTWDKVNLYNNKFTDALSDIALYGRTNRALSIQDNICTPELTTQGTYAKAWYREEDGIYLYKGDFKGYECNAEYISSIIADKLKLDHVDYELTHIDGKRYCKCKNICSENYSIAPADDLAFALGLSSITLSNWLQIFTDKERDSFLWMLLFDGIIGNQDRHLLNWGVLIDNESNNILGLHPLFDHNCAVDLSVDISKITPSSIYTDKSVLDIARYSFKRLDDAPQKLNNLLNWYNTKECKQIFKCIYGRLNELEYLKNNLRLILQ